MLYQMIHFLTGYCLVKIEGNHQERFLNLCANKKILLWNVVKKENATFFYISRTGCRFLQEICEKTGCKFSYEKRAGIPYLFYRYRKRKITLLFLFLCGIALYIMSGRLWRIEIVGEKQYRQEDILSYLKKKQISYGISTDNISCEELEENLREDYPDIAWVSCELRGTMLRISLSEVLNPKQNEEENTPCHLIATKEGTVDSIITRQGVPKVKKGSRVKKGQVLISGTVELTDDFGEKLSKTYVCASGDIYVRRNIVYQDKLSYMNYQKRYTGEQNQIYRVKFSFQEPQMIVTLPTSLKSLENVDREIRRYPVKLGKNFYLPVTFYKIIEKEYVAQKKINTPKEGKAILKHRLQAFLAEYEAKGVEILKNNVRIDCDKKECTAKGILVIREKIGKKKKIGGKRQRGVHK